ncbi:hypothetical protein [Dialister succinatiphilus]
MKNQTEGYVIASWQGNIPEKREGGQRRGKVKGCKALPGFSWFMMRSI